MYRLMLKMYQKEYKMQTYNSRKIILNNVSDIIYSIIKDLTKLDKNIELTEEYLPNKETIEAMENCINNKNCTKYNDFDELWNECNA